MARIAGVRKGGGILARIAFFLCRRKVGKVVQPLRIYALHPRALLGYGQMEQAQKWLAQQESFSVIMVKYASVIEEPLKQCRRVDEFLEGDGDVKKMAAVIDSRLHRNRNYDSAI